jgi:hypothetical protein
VELSRPVSLIRRIPEQLAQLVLPSILLAQALRFSRGKSLAKIYLPSTLPVFLVGRDVRA